MQKSKIYQTTGSYKFLHKIYDVLMKVSGANTLLIYIKTDIKFAYKIYMIPLVMFHVFRHAPVTLANFFVSYGDFNGIIPETC